MRTNLIIVFLYFVGLFVGMFVEIPKGIIESDLSTYVLCFLLFFIGISIGFDLSAFKSIKKIGYKIILVPLGIIIGSLLGGSTILFFANDLNLKELFAISSGYGYYSLSSIYITKLCGDMPGILALMTNIVRELFTLLFAPFLVSFFGKLAPIASGGATSMDTTLPIIIRSSGKEFSIISVFSGVVLTISVPFIIPFILSY